MKNDPITLIAALDKNRQASGQLYFDDGITHHYREKNEFILANLSFNNNAMEYK